MHTHVRTHNILREYLINVIIITIILLSLIYRKTQHSILFQHYLFLALLMLNNIEHLVFMFSGFICNRTNQALK